MPREREQRLHCISAVDAVIGILGVEYNINTKWIWEWGATLCVRADDKKKRENHDSFVALKLKSQQIFLSNFFIFRSWPVVREAFALCMNIIPHLMTGWKEKSENRTHVKTHPRWMFVSPTLCFHRATYYLPESFHRDDSEIVLFLAKTERKESWKWWLIKHAVDFFCIRQQFTVNDDRSLFKSTFKWLKKASVFHMWDTSRGRTVEKNREYHVAILVVIM